MPRHQGYDEVTGMTTSTDSRRSDFSQMDDAGISKEHVRRIFFACEEIALDGFEAELPGVVPYCHQIGVITEVEELLARPFCDFTLEERHEIVAVEMVLEGLIAGL